MRYSSALVVLAAGLAAAQSSSSAAAVSTSTGTSSSSGSGSCADQQGTIDACLESTQPQVEACGSNDWTCLCDNSRAVDTCYAGCPSHPDAFGQEQTTNSYCNAAEAYPSSSSSGTRAATGTGSSPTTASTASTSSDAGTAVQTGFADESGSSDSAQASESGNAASGFAPAGGLLAAIFGLALI